MNNPVYTFAVTDSCNTTLEVRSPDPGIMITGVYNIPMLAQFLPPKELCIVHPAFFANMFKTPQLHGVRHTAPYFHDNSAKSLEEVMEQYKFLFTSNIGVPIADSNILLTQQDIDDIVAFLRLFWSTARTTAAQGEQRRWECHAQEGRTAERADLLRPRACRESAIAVRKPSPLAFVCRGAASVVVDTRLAASGASA